MYWSVGPENEQATFSFPSKNGSSINVNSSLSGSIGPRGHEPLVSRSTFREIVDPTMTLLKALVQVQPPGANLFIHSDMVSQRGCRGSSEVHKSLLVPLI